MPLALISFSWLLVLTIGVMLGRGMHELRGHTAGIIYAIPWLFLTLLFFITGCIGIGILFV